MLVIIPVFHGSCESLESSQSLFPPLNATYIGLWELWNSIFGDSLRRRYGNYMETGPDQFRTTLYLQGGRPPPGGGPDTSLWGS